MDPLMIEAMVRAHLQARTEYHATRRRRWVVASPIPSRVFYRHRPLSRATGRPG